MRLFASIGKKHLDGHKELTSNNELIDLASVNKDAVKKLYFPTLSPNGKPMEVLVKPGDKVKKGSLIAKRTDFNVPIYSSVSGVVLEQEDIYSCQLGKAIPHIVIENDYKYEMEAPLKLVNKNSSKEEIFEAIINAGIVGMGGAGFPTYVKYNNPTNIDTILVNGVECEPYLTTDYATGKHSVDNLLKAIDLLIYYASAKQGIIAIKEHKQALKDAINEKIGEYSNIKLIEVPDAYPMGWERTLIKQTLNREYKVLPAEAGVIINNIQSVINLGRAFFEGIRASSRIVTVSGNGIKKPSNIITLFGTLASELTKLCDGYEDTDVVLLPGGPMCSKATNNENFPMLMQMGGLTILEHKAYHVDPCLRCGRCTLHCPANLQPVEIKNAYDRKDYDRAEKLGAMSCVECGMCSYICPSHIELTDTIHKCKMILKLKKK